MKRTKRPPFIFRLMLSSLFLPIFISLIYVLILSIVQLPNESSILYRDLYLIFGVPEAWFFLFIVTFPFLLGIWIFWSGQWRLPLFVAGTVYFGLILLGIIGYLVLYSPPEKRIIKWNFGNYEKTDVYCNGIYLGQTPFEIRVSELLEKVPEWTSPPKQQWYSKNTQTDHSSYTWFPWDDFRSKERFLETRELLTFESPKQLSYVARKKLSDKYDTGCRYWWRFENNKSHLSVHKSTNGVYDYNQAFEEILEYHSPNDIFSLFAPVHASLLVDVLEELTESEKNDWDKHVLKHWSLLSEPLTQGLREKIAKYLSKNPNDPHIKIFETALDSTARLKYGLSNPPTEEESRKLLTKWVDGASYFPFDKSFQLHIASNVGVETGNTCSPIAVANHTESPLIDAAIKLIGETIQKPLVEQWKKNYYRYDDSWVPLLYVAKTNQSAEYFNDFTRYFATTHDGRLELLENQNKLVIPLFKTFLYQKSIFNIIFNDNVTYQQVENRINFYGEVNNPLLEPIFREYIAHVLANPKYSESNRNRLNLSVLKIIFERIDREEVDKNGLDVWVASLPIPQRFKNVLIQKIRLKSNGSKSFSDLLQQAAGFEMLIETQITADDVNHWFAKNPDGTLDKFFQAFENEFELSEGIITKESYGNRTKLIDGINVTENFDYKFGDVQTWYDMDGKFSGTDNLNRYLVTALLQTDTPETQKTIKQLCNNHEGLWFVLQVIAGESWQHLTNLLATKSLYLNRSYLDISIDYPDYVFDALEGLKFENMPLSSLSLVLSFCPSPKAEQLLKKWSQMEEEVKEEYKTQKQNFANDLKFWRERKTIREQKKELFQKLVKEEITPNDLLPSPPPWIWTKDGYVQVSE
jgi:hypothetical protein